MRPDATRIDLIDGVTAWLSDVEIPNAGVTCNVVTTEGMRTLDHPELVFAVRALPDLARDAVAGVLASLLRGIARAAAAGHRVSAGGVTRFGGPVFGFDGVFYVPSQPIGALHVPSTTLAGLFASADELTGVERFGARRLSSLLARQTTYYPTTPWTDPRRERFALTSWPSVLANMPIVRMAGATVVYEAGTIQLRLARACRSILAGVLPQLGETPPTFVLHAVDPRADACLVWSPGQSEAAAVAPPGSRGERIGGCFLAFANQQPDNRSQMVEDGFAYFLRDDDYARLRAAWLAGGDLTIRASRPGDGDLVLTWSDDLAAELPAPTAGPVRVVGIQLLVEPTGTPASDVGAYINALEAAAARTMPVVDAAYEVLARVWVDPSGAPEIQLGTRPFEPPAEALQAALDALLGVAPPPTTARFGFDLHVSVDAAQPGR